MQFFLVESRAVAVFLSLDHGLAELVGAQFTVLSGSKEAPFEIKAAENVHDHLGALGENALNEAQALESP